MTASQFSRFLLLRRGEYNWGLVEYETALKKGVSEFHGGVSEPSVGPSYYR